MGDWFPKWKPLGGGGGGGGGVWATSFTRQPFVLLDSQVIRIFCLKNHLIILRAVAYVIRGMVYFRAERDQPENY